MNKETILIVDDNPANLGVLFDYLESAGFTVLVDNGGESAVRAISHHRPDIILLDVMMPGVDGFETCRRLKADEGTRDIPVIFMTALTDVVDEVRGLELGAVDYITKPIKVETVLARLNLHLTIRRLQGELQEKNARLQEAIDSVKVLSGLLPICANCKNIRDDRGYWNQIEEYIQRHSEAEFSHGLCPNCVKELYGEQVWKEVQDKP